MAARPDSSVPESPPIPSPAVNETIYLIDKPGAAQSVLSIGRTGTSIRSPDRYALRVLSADFSGRIDGRLRDDKAYTYGLSTSFDFRKAAGLFVLEGSVETAKTKEAVVEIFKEMTELDGGKPVTVEDITAIQTADDPALAHRFETTADVASEVAYMVSHELPDDHFATELAGHQGVKKTDVDRVAKQYLTPERMTILVVGDRSRIEAPLRSLPFVKTIRLLDVQGSPLPERAPAPETPARTGLQ